MTKRKAAKDFNHYGRDYKVGDEIDLADDLVADMENRGMIAKARPKAAPLADPPAAHPSNPETETSERPAEGRTRRAGRAAEEH